jgi:hypothetical protein
MKYIPVLLLFLCLIAATGSAQLMASTIAAPASVVNDGPTIIKVGAYILNVGKFEVSSGSYTVDFYLSMSCSKECNPNFEFMNGRSTSMDKLIDEPTEKFYRIQASLSQNIDLRDYPFDRHALSIELEDKTKTVEEQIFIPDTNQSGIDPAVIIVGWQLDGWNSTVTDHHYAAYGENYSRFKFDIEISRVTLASVIKSFLPVLFMVFITLLSLLLRADKVTTRLTLNISTLLAAVMFHVNLTSSIPPVGYLTFADKFMLSTYLIMLLTLFSGIMLMRHTDSKEVEVAEKIYKFSLRAIPIFTILIFFGIILLL